MCPVCSAPSTGGLCPACMSVTSTHEAVKPPPMLWRRGSVAQVRDRSMTYSHARELIARDDISIADLEQVRDRLPRSKRGETLRNKINKRIKEINDPASDFRRKLEQLSDATWGE